MDINNLLVFVRVVQAGSFSKAAQTLGIPKSTVSRKVADLEDELGVPLLLRTTRSLRVTETGEAYFNQGLKVVAEIETANTLLSDIQKTPQGVLKLTAPADFGSHFLGQIIRTFLNKNEKVKVDVVLTERVVDLINENFDIAIRVGDLRDSSLMAKKIGSLDMQLYASPQYIKEFGEPSMCDDLKKHRCIIFTGEDRQNKWELQGPKGPQTVDVKGRISCNLMALVKEFALAGEGVAFMPHFLCADEVKRGRLQVVLKDWVFVSGPIHAVYPAQKHLQPKVRAFIDHLASEFKS